MFLLSTMTLMTHVASRLKRRWLPMPEIALNDDPYDKDLLPPLARWSSAAWPARSENLWHHLIPYGDHLPTWLAQMTYEEWTVLSQQALQHLQQVEAYGAKMLCWHDELFPPLLRHIQAPPRIISFWGDVELWHFPLIAIVGSRKASARAVQESFHTAQRLAEEGYAVVSGGAFGCDQAAHQGVLSVGLTPAPTIVVFASGLGHLYPKHLMPIFQKIMTTQGILMSECLWWETSQPYDFPIRNRIIAGLVPVVLLMEAAARSGALITARSALDHGRDVWVLTPERDDIRAQGSLALIEEGASTFDGSASLIHSLQSGQLDFFPAEVAFG